jgi:hypothetical protein
MITNFNEARWNFPDAATISTLCFASAVTRGLCHERAISATLSSATSLDGIVADGIFWLHYQDGDVSTAISGTRCCDCLATNEVFRLRCHQGDVSAALRAMKFFVGLVATGCFEDSVAMAVLRLQGCDRRS